VCVLYKKGIKVFCVIFLMLIEVGLICLMNKTILNKKESITLEEKEILDNKLISLMIEQSDGTYLESDTNSWPTDMIYNNELSGCLDNYGNIVDNALSFDKESNTAVVYTSITSNCYLYFDLNIEQ